MAINWETIPTKREQVISLVVFAAVLGFLVHFGFGYQQAEREAQGRREEALLMERGALKKFLQVAPQLKRVASRKKAQDDKLEILMGEKEARYPDLPAALPQLTEPSFLQGVHLAGFSFQPDVQESGYTRTDFVLETAANFSHLVSYLEKLEGFPALFMINDLVMSLQEGKAGGVKGEISCRFFKKA